MNTKPKKNLNEKPEWAMIFDVDGTMVDNSKYHESAWIELGKRHNIPIDHNFYMKNIHSKSNIDVAHDVFKEMVGLEKGLSFGVEKGAIYRQMYRPVLREIPGFTNLIKILSSMNVPCAAASNSPRPNIDMVLEELKIENCFCAVIDNSQVKKGKPDPEMFLAAAEKMQVHPSKCIVIEDSISGFKAAENAKMPYIVITVGANQKDLKYAVNPKAMHKDFTTLTIEELKCCLR